MNVKRILTATAAVLALSAAPALAAPIVLDFEGIADNTAVGNFYAGVGVTFSNNTLALVDADAGGGGNFANEPSPNTIMFFLGGGASVMNVAAGFDTGFSFFYTALNNPGSLIVWSGLNGTGAQLAALALPTNSSNCAGDPTGQFCNFTAIGVGFLGIAQSVTFAGVNNQIGFDNVTFGATTPGGGTPVPEPATLLLIGSGIGAGILRRRQRKAQA